MTDALSSLPLPPGEFGLPLIGDTLNFLQDPQFAQKRHQQLGPIFKTRILGKPTIFMRGAEASRFVLNHENQYFAVSWPPSTQALLGPLSLALQAGGEHQKRRKLLYQAFQPRALASYVEVMEEITQRYLHQWAEKGTLTWYPELRKYTFDIAGKLFVGLDSSSQTRLSHEFEVWSQGLFSIALNVPWTQFGRAWRSRKLLLAEIEAIVRQRQQQPDPGSDALGLMIQARDEEGNGLSLEELKDQVLLLLFAGHETLTSAIASFCLQLAQHPQVLAKVRAEQQQFSAQEPLTLEQLKQMTYLEQVLREVLRLSPPVGGVFREVIRACEFNGYQLPQGWGVLYQISQTHANAELYPEPDQFDPDRFSPERLNNLKPFSYVPFGSGLRECLGKEFARLELKLFAAQLVRGYDWELLPHQDLTLVAVPTPHPRDGLQVKIRRLVEPTSCIA
ncbi:MAG: cytochrome P450 [Actinomycetota bacterium]